MNIKETSLQKALNAAACKELPKAVSEDNADSYWHKAIALVRKRDQTQSYCLVERGSDGIIRYKADFGSSAIIFGLISIHPYVVIDLKRFGFSGTDAQFKAYIQRTMGLTWDEVNQLPDAAWEQMKIEYAKKAQEESDARFQMTGTAEITDEEEKGEEASAITEPSEAPDSALIAEDGSVEEFTVISQANSITNKEAKKRGRKAKK